MAIDVISVQFNGGFLPNLRLLNLRYNTSTKLSLPCAMAFPRIGHGPAMSQGRILEKSKVGRGYWGALFPAKGKQSDVFRKHTTVVCIRTAVKVPIPQNSCCYVPRRFLELRMARRWAKEGSWSSLEVGSGYWGALFPA